MEGRAALAAHRRWQPLGGRDPHRPAPAGPSQCGSRLGGRSPWRPAPRVCRRRGWSSSVPGCGRRCALCPGGGGRRSHPSPAAGRAAAAVRRHRLIGALLRLPTSLHLSGPALRATRPVLLRRGNGCADLQGHRPDRGARRRGGGVGVATRERRRPGAAARHRSMSRRAPLVSPALSLRLARGYPGTGGSRVKGIQRPARTLELRLLSEGPGLHPSSRSRRAGDHAATRVSSPGWPRLSEFSQSVVNAGAYPAPMRPPRGDCPRAR